MTDNNVRIHLEPTPRHTYAVYALARARSQCTAKDRVGRFDGSYADCLLVSFHFILFYFVFVEWLFCVHCLGTECCILASLRLFGIFHGVQYRCLRHCDQACDCCSLLLLLLWLLSCIYSHYFCLLPCRLVLIVCLFCLNRFCMPFATTSMTMAWRKLKLKLRHKSARSLC